MIIKVLIENTEKDGFCSEHGLCLYVEFKGKKYLIDSGASDRFVANADKLSINLNDIDAAFLSHAHYDHSSGYSAFFDLNDHAKVYLQKSSQNKYYYKIAGPLKKYIGIPEGMLEKYSDRFEYIDGAANPFEGIYIVPHSSEGILERAKHTHMCVVVGNETKYDDFSHEQTVVFEEEDGLILFNSCSHSGVDIALDEVKRTFPGKRIKAYVGGFHMMGMTGVSSTSYSKEEVYEVANKLKLTPDVKFYSGHCTGIVAFEWLKDILGDRLEAFEPGKIISI